MSNIQIYDGYDPFKDFKLANNCYFYTQEINSRMFNISTGINNNNIYQEKIITDGVIDILKINHDTKYMIWNNNLITLNDGLSIKIKLEQANFFINVINRNNEQIYDIHIKPENIHLLSVILEFLRQHNKGLIDTNTIALQYPSTLILESYQGGKYSKEVEDFSPKTKKKRRKRY